MSIRIGAFAVQAVTLLLHQANVPEALKQFAQHMSAFRRIPLPPPPAAASAHGTWLVRQYTVMGELLSSRVEAGLLPQQVQEPPSLVRDPVSKLQKGGQTENMDGSHMRGQLAVIKQCKRPSVSSWTIVPFQMSVIITFLTSIAT